MERKARFRLLASDAPTKLGLTLAAANGHATKLKVLVDRCNLGEVEIGDYMQTLRFQLPKSNGAGPPLNGSEVVWVTLKPAAACGSRAGDQPKIVLKSAWVE